MPRSKAARILIFILFILTVLFGYNYFFQPFAIDEQPVAVMPSPSPEASHDFELDIPGLIVSMSPEQKIAQLLALPVNLETQELTPQSTLSAQINQMAQNESSQEAEVAEIKPGFVTIFGEKLSAQKTQQRIRALRDVAVLTLGQDNKPQQIKPAFAVDHEGGRVQRLSGDGFTVMPSWQEMCGQEQASRAAILRQSSLELKSAGIDIVLAPMADTATNNPVLGDRICDDSPATVSAKVNEYVGLFDFADITPVVKHFPGIGQTTRDLHFNFQSISPDQGELNVFRMVMDSFPEIGIMTTFVGVNNQDPGVPCALSKDCVGQLVSEYPDALLFTDALEMVSAGVQDASGSASLSKRTELAIKAGNHIMIYGQAVDPEEFKEIISDLTELYQNDQEFADQVDSQVMRVLKYKQKQGLL